MGSADLPGIRAERDRLAAWKAEAIPVLDGLQELGHALGIKLGKRITGRDAVDAALDLRNERAALLAEVERLQESSDAWRRECKRLLEGKRRQAAVIERVTTLAVGWEDETRMHTQDGAHGAAYGLRHATEDLRAALAHDGTPAPPEPAKPPTGHTGALGDGADYGGGA